MQNLFMKEEDQINKIDQATENPETARKKRIKMHLVKKTRLAAKSIAALFSVPFGKKL